jgi:gliding motility-associated-like protein
LQLVFSSYFHWAVMRKCYALLICVWLALPSAATHITGGEMYYTYNGFSNGEYQYTVTLKLYQRCNSGRQFPNPTIISVFDKTTNGRVRDLSVPLGDIRTIAITNPDPCITNPPTVCYEIAYYTFNISLPGTPAGYVMASQVNYRINGISNLMGGQIGAMYTADIPGTSQITDAPENQSATFIGSDLVIVCANNDFSYSFAAEDADGDQLRYSFCTAYESTSGGGGAATATGPPPFPPVPYSPFFSGNTPLGNAVQVNPLTGLLTGIAPAEGIYVVTVCVEEIRRGQVIAVQRKDIQINVAGCDIAAASLQPEYLLCDNTQTLSVSNLSNSPLIVSYAWEVTNTNGTSLLSASTSSITYTFPDTGLYYIKLTINPDQPCTDSTKALVRVYPGFRAAFNTSGICVTKPTFFTDQSSSVYGTVNSWNWDFGEPTLTSDISNLQNPNYTYPGMGPKNATLIVTDTKGCRDTITHLLNIIDKPPITLGFRDSLICRNDQVQLQASGSGVFSWTPSSGLVNASTGTPTATPSTTTTFYVDLDDNGCKNRDSVKIRVVDFVTLAPMSDTVICQGDTIRLRVQSDGFRFSWTPANQLLDPTIKSPLAVTSLTTIYGVTAFLGGCSSTANIGVTTVPYPTAFAGSDTTICYNTPVFLQGQTDGARWTWSPANTIRDPGLLRTMAYPARTTAFVLTAFDNRGCPKPGKDSVIVTVLPKMQVSAGNDTAVIIGQPLQLNGTGGETYEWSPAAYLSATNIYNPIALFSETTSGLRYKLVASSGFGCRDSAYINIKVFATGPTVFVPTAFTPNNDGKNDLLVPIAVGLKEIEYFRVFNRWGQMVFSTTTNGRGWDGRINGQLQGTNTYVWLVKATDYNGAPYFLKGVVTLIR